jgi:hypothetical protein
MPLDLKSSSKVSELVIDVLSRAFSDVRIVDVIIEEQDEFEINNDYIRLKVIFEGNPKDNSWGASAVRLLRPKLSEAGEDVFPILSFISNSEYSISNSERVGM